MKPPIIFFLRLYPCFESTYYTKLNWTFQARVSNVSLLKFLKTVLQLHHTRHKGPPIWSLVPKTILPWVTLACKLFIYFFEKFNQLTCKWQTHLRGQDNLGGHVLLPQLAVGWPYQAEQLFLIWKLWLVCQPSVVCAFWVSLGQGTTVTTLNP